MPNNNRTEWDTRILNINSTNFRTPSFRIEKVDIISFPPYPTMGNIRGVNQLIYCNRVTFSNADILYTNGTFKYMLFPRFAVDFTGQNQNIKSDADSFYYFIANLGREVQIPIRHMFNNNLGNLFFALSDDILDEIIAEKVKWVNLGYTSEPDYFPQQNIMSPGDLNQVTKQWVDANFRKEQAVGYWQRNISVPPLNAQVNVPVLSSTTNIPSEPLVPTQRRLITAADIKVGENQATEGTYIKRQALITRMARETNTKMSGTPTNWRVYRDNELSEANAFFVDDESARFLAGHYGDKLDLVLSSPLGSNVGTVRKASYAERAMVIDTVGEKAAWKKQWDSLMVANTNLNDASRNNSFLLEFKQSVQYITQQQAQ